MDKNSYHTLHENACTHRVFIPKCRFAICIWMTVWQRTGIWRLTVWEPYMGVPIEEIL